MDIQDAYYQVASVTNDLKFKINNCPDKEYYQKLRLNVDKLCSSCYMKIINSYQYQISIINKNNLIEDNISIGLIETSRPNTPTNLMKTSNLKDLKIEMLDNQNNQVQKYSFSQQMELLSTVLLKYQNEN
ncbi:38361_t:CDS:2, partial [Gigaspora margarita]